MKEVSIEVPSPGEAVHEVAIEEVSVQNGESVSDGDVLFTIESDKASMEVCAPASGVVKYTTEIKEEMTLKCNSVIGHIEVSDSTEVKPEEKRPEPKEQEGEVGPEPAHKEESTEPALTIPGRKQQTREEKEAAMSQIMVDRFKAAAIRNFELSQEHQTPVTTFNEVDLSMIANARRVHGKSFLDKHEVKLGYMSFFARACVLAIKDFPLINAQLDNKKMEYTMFNYVNLGIAVSTDKGLMVPNVRNAQDLSLAEMELSIYDIAKRGREGKLKPGDLGNGTFTITNGGVFGSMLSTPMLNYPQSAILGMHNIQERVVVVDGKQVVRPMMYLALTYDHRVINGKESVSFLVRVKTLLENPGDLISGNSLEKELLGL
jgi:2-oxoglutarate dehydrogenase E2 component (dihydrolipoamide succinyltransferase)